jgi:serine/threonine protein kinase/tetratricopeptide (TPR) repeat protein
VEALNDGLGEGLALGPYDLLSLVGIGGMGRVWSARHRPSGSRVAIKVLTSMAASHQGILRAFRSEIRACAGLNHPSIVRILDRGEVPRSLDLATAGQIPAGTPFFAMEYVAGGSLGPWCGQLRWPEIQAVLLGLLDALAHAHSRGLIHRDIKPENVLLTPDRTEVKLTDFGLVHGVERASRGTRDRGLVGTPRYMAPEQCVGRWRDYGPWTDFYALGGLAYALAAGHAPFAHITAQYELILAHRESPPPRLEPRVPVPDGLQDWLHVMLAKDPKDRFQRASEAAAALHRLGDAPTLLSYPDDDEDHVLTDPRLDGTASILLSHPSLRLSPVLGTVTQKTGSVNAAVETGRTEIPVPGVPIRWSPGDGALGDLPDDAAGTGLGLFWLRSLAFVGREAERDALWASLRRVQETNRSEVFLLSGPAGVGKSRLAQWLCERGHEIGGVDFVKATHGPGAADAANLGTMLARHFRTRGLRWNEVRVRMGELLQPLGVTDREDWDAVAELVHPTTDTNEAQETLGIRLESKREMLVLLRRTLVRLARRRPLVVWLDDAHHGLEPLLFARLFAEDEPPEAAPILVVATVNPDAAGPAMAEQLGQRRRAPGVQELALGPLPPPEHHLLVRQLLPLDDDLAAQVEERTAGNPLFAVQLVGGWVDQGRLEPSERGFRLGQAEDSALPEDLMAVWADRVRAFLAGPHRSVHDAPALELAAALGPGLRDLEFWGVCDVAGLAPKLELLDDLLDDGLARGQREGSTDTFDFAHAMLRDILLKQAEDGDRLQAHHLACARFLGFEGGPGRTERMARHLLAAGRPQEALGPLFSGTWELMRAGELRRAGAALGELKTTLDRLGIEPDDERRGQALLLEVRLLAQDGDLGRFDEVSTHGLELALALGWDDTTVYLTYEVARRQRQRGRLEEAAEGLDAALAWATDRKQHDLMAQCLAEQAELALERGEVVHARGLLQRCLGVYDQQGEGLLAGQALLRLAEIASRLGEPREAEEYLDLAADLFGRWGSRVGVADVAAGRARAERARGRMDRALEHQRDAIARYRSLAAPALGAALVDLAELHLHVGDRAAAIGDLETAIAVLGPDSGEVYERAHQLRHVARRSKD